MLKKIPVEGKEMLEDAKGVPSDNMKERLPG